MCGIVGFIDCGQNFESKKSAKQKLRAAAETIAHRGPDDSGLTITETPSGLLGLAHRRLAILDLDHTAAQPMASSSGKSTIIFNGEIYNYRDIRSALDRDNHAFKTSGDTEVLINALEHYGTQETLKKVQGMFAFACYDNEAQSLTFAVDRFGEKPLYIGWAGESLIFASELKAFHAFPQFKNKISNNALTSMMRYRHCAAPFTIYEGIWRLPAGQYLELDLNALKPGEDLSAKAKTYWHPSHVFTGKKPNQIKAEDALDQLDELLNNKIRQAMASDVPLGSFLSGGIDSSLITSIAQKHSPKPLKTFTIAFENEHYNEAPFASAIADHLGTQHTEHLITSQDLIEIIPRLPEIYDEPFAIGSQLPMIKLAELAKKDVTVALCGAGGDELFSGYHHHHKILPKYWPHIEKVPHVLRSPLAAIFRSTPKKFLNPLWYRRAQMLAGLIPQDNILLAQRSFWSATDSPEQYTKNGREIPLSVWDEARPYKQTSNLNRLLAADIEFFLQQHILPNTDRSSMACSLEVRSPLLDPDIWEFSAGLPDHMKHNGQSAKWILQELLARYIPRELFDRKKSGFNVPIGNWLRDDLKDWAEELLLCEQFKNSPYLNAPEIIKLWNDLQNGDKRHVKLIWTVLILQQWLNKYHP